MHGFCNLCTKFRELSQDHVPPQGSTSLRRAELKNLVDAFRDARRSTGSISRGCWIFATLAAPSDPEQRQIPLNLQGLQQSALRRSLRSGDQSHLSGNQLARESGRWRVLPERVSVTVKTHYLLRGIIGHLIAAIQSPDPSKPLPAYQLDKFAALRDYFFDETLPLPPNVTFYYWLYPYQETTIVKSLGISSRDGESHILGDLLKFFPVAY